MLHNSLIKRENIGKIFEELAKEYELRGGTDLVNIYLVGGAAIMLDFDYRMSTIDIDALYKKNEVLTDAIKSVASKMKLPSDWLNDNVAATPSYSNEIVNKSKAVSKYGKYITVYSLEPKYLIAMKLKSSRPTGGDLDDVLMMIYELRFKNVSITYEEIIGAYKELYKDFSNTYDYFLLKAKEAFNIPVSDFEHLLKK